jgi:hypothetical protein
MPDLRCGRKNAALRLAERAPWRCATPTRIPGLSDCAVVSAVISVFPPMAVIQGARSLAARSVYAREDRNFGGPSLRAAVARGPYQLIEKLLAASERS